VEKSNEPTLVVNDLTKLLTDPDGLERVSKMSALEILPFLTAHISPAESLNANIQMMHRTQTSII